MDTSEALHSLGLYYLGGDTFRLLAQANAAYSLYSTPFSAMPLDANQSMPVTLSFSEPIKVVRLSSANAGSIALNVEVTEGGGAFLWLYTQEQAYPDTRALGIDAQGKYELPLADTIALASSAADHLVAVQIPFHYTRDPVSVTVEWQSQP